jgi:imidazoleglycerol phosphate synthase cyclase subunit
MLDGMSARFGCQCTVLAVDAKRRAGGGWAVVIRSGIDTTRIDAIEWIKEAVGRGAGEILLTSWDRDGTRSGYDLELLKAASSAVNVPVIASGGAANPRQLFEAFGAGADAVLAASIFHDGEYTVADVKRELIDMGVEVRR